MENGSANSKSFILKLRTQRLKLAATQARQSIAAILAEDTGARRTHLISPAPEEEYAINHP